MFLAFQRRLRVVFDGLGSADFAVTRGFTGVVSYPCFTVEHREQEG